MTPMPEPSTPNVCPRCDGSGHEPDKPGKPGRDWMTCSLCSNKVGRPEPGHAPTEADWERQRRD